MPTARDICLNAWTDSGVKGVEVPSISNAELEFALRKLNEVISILVNKALWKYTQTEVDFTLVPGQNTYTIGPTGEIVTQRPQKIDQLKYLKGDTWYPLDQKSNSWFDNTYESTTVGSDPFWWTYYPTYPNGTIKFLRPTNNNWDLKVFYQSFIDTVDLNTSVDQPPGYVAFLTTALAQRLASTSGFMEMASSLKSQELSMLDTIELNNVKPAEAQSTFGGKGQYNYKSDVNQY